MFVDVGYGVMFLFGLGLDCESGYNNFGGIEVGNVVVWVGMWSEMLVFFD